MSNSKNTYQSKFYPQFSDLLNRYLGESERSISWLAGRLELSPSTVSRWINHDSRPGDPEVIIRIADALGIYDADRESLLEAAGYLLRVQNQNPSSDNLNINHDAEDTSPISIPSPAVDELDQTYSDRIPQASSTVGIPPFMAPTRPTHGVFGRDAQLKELSKLLVIDDVHMTDVPPVAIYGLGGIGKTTLATILGRSPTIPSIYPDGVLWVSIGPNPTIRLLLDSWGKAMQVDLLPERDEKACSDRLRDILHYRRVLLIIDDVWEAVHGHYFTVAGPHCRTLITTRETPTAYELATRQRSIQLDVLQMSDALALLGSLAPDAIASDIKLCRNFCETVEFLPLALTLAGRFLAHESDVPERMTRLLGELVERRESRLKLFQTEQRIGIEDKAPSLQAILGMSVERLDSIDQERFAMASVFGGDPLTWDINAAAFVWECSIEEAERTTAHFIQRGLVARREDRYWMHALLADYATEMMQERGL